LPIVVSTNPKDYALVQRTLEQANVKSKVLRNTRHSKGSLAALEFALGEVSSEHVLMSFADIYFFENPFKSFCGLSKHTLGISKAFDKKELSLGGIVFVNKNYVERIIEKPIKNNKGYRWNGLALFSRSDVTNLSEFLKASPSNPREGDFFEYLRKDKKVNFSFLECSDFINVNRPENLMVASLYRFSEVKNEPKILSLASDTKRLILNKI